jgi:hypothetical protein
MEHPRLIVAPGGRTVAAWDEGGDVLARIRTPGATWAPVVRVGGDTGEAVDLNLAGAPTGGAIATWSNRLGAGLDRHYAIRTAILSDTGAWARPDVIDWRAVNPPHATGALGANGEAVAAWVSEGGRTVTSAATRSAAGPWTAPAVLGRNAGLFGLPASAAVDGSGRAVVIPGVGTAAAQAPGGSWAHYPLTPTVGRSFGVAAITDATGGVVVLRSSAERVHVERPGDATAVAVPASVGIPAIAVGDDGTTVVVWATFGRGSRVSAAVAEGGP